MQVLKFGGSSVANAENIAKVLAIVAERAASSRTIVVVSALGGVTDLLLNAAALAASGSEDYKPLVKLLEERHISAIKQLIPIQEQSGIVSELLANLNEVEDLLKGLFYLQELTNKSKDKIAAYGELLSSKIIAKAIQSAGTLVEWTDAREMISTNADYTKANVNFAVTNQKIVQFFQHSTANLFLLPGFIARDSTGATTTLGRGGSDYTAAVVAAALGAEKLEIWTDVSGMMTADPRLTKNAKIIPTISYAEAMELSHFGAKVVYPPTIQPVMALGIPVWIKNTFAPEDRGTLIVDKADSNDNIVQGISSANNISLISLEGTGMVGIPGFSKRLFEALSNEKINVILITQSSSEHSISVGILSGDVERAKFAVDNMFSNEIALRKVEPLKVENDLSIVAIVGEQMKNHTGISGKMFSALGKNGINIRAIAQGSSEKNISAVINSVDVKKSINVLHEEFFETTYKQINLYITGTGNVGEKLLLQLQHQHHFLMEHLHLHIRVVGLSNSRKMLIDEKGINLVDWAELLEAGEQASIEKFTDDIIAKNLRNSIFVDITANATVAEAYAKLLQKSVSVVACNKIAASSNHKNYQFLKDLARKYNGQLLFETNVGAGLPVIATLNDLVNSGDKVNKMQAVLSGTLNFVFNNYDGTKPFADVVKQAQEEGYTEPDPRLDLGGTDVMRKILILAREASYPLEMENIANNGFMPEVCMQGSVKDFYHSMREKEQHFKQLYEAAKAKNCILKFVATFDGGKASVGLQHIDPTHDLYHLYGKDNVVLFFTDRYKDQPLVVKGAGAGAEVTASGVFADIIRASKN